MTTDRDDEATGCRTRIEWDLDAVEAEALWDALHRHGGALLLDLPDEYALRMLRATMNLIALIDNACVLRPDGDT